MSSEQTHPLRTPFCLLCPRVLSAENTSSIVNVTSLPPTNQDQEGAGLAISTLLMKAEEKLIVEREPFGRVSADLWIDRGEIWNGK